MADAYICRRGGGGAGGAGGSELVIVGSATHPANAAQNMIWIDTSTEITGYVLSATEPVNPIEGMVWIIIENGGGVKMASPLGGDWITVYLLSAKQYIDGTWVDKEAQNYLDGAWGDWIDWDKWIVKAGRYKLPMVAEGKPYDPSYSPTTFTVTEVDGGIRFGQIGGTGMVYWGPVDLTDVDTLIIEGDFSGMNSACPTDYMLAVWKSISTQINTFTSKVQLTDTGATLNVSGLTGEYYVGFTVRNAGYEIVTNLYAE